MRLIAAVRRAISQLEPKINNLAMAAGALAIGTALHLTGTPERLAAAAGVTAYLIFLVIELGAKLDSALRKIERIEEVVERLHNRRPPGGFVP